MDIFICKLLLALFSMYIFDIISVYIHPFICKKHLVNKHVSESERWFFIHIINNIFIINACYFEIVRCVKNLYICDTQPIYNSTQNAFIIAKASHIYHLLFFKNNSYDILLHHIVMCVFCGPIVYIFSNTAMAASMMFFLSGLPGFLDYINLYLVKLGYLSSKHQKIIYLYISLILRCPGILFFSIAQMLYNNGETTSEYIMRNILGLITMWNSQYFLYLTIKDVIKKNVLA